MVVLGVRIRRKRERGEQQNGQGNHLQIAHNDNNNEKKKKKKKKMIVFFLFFRTTTRW
jgi:hypothetical protein